MLNFNHSIRFHLIFELIFNFVIIDIICNYSQNAARVILTTSKMASLLNADGDHVLISCTCSALSPLTRLYFCRHCIKLRCQLCVSHEVSIRKCFIDKNFVFSKSQPSYSNSASF